MGLMVSPNITLQNRLIWNVIKMCVYLPLKTSYLPSTIRLRKFFPVTIPYYSVAMQGNSNIIDHQTCIAFLKINQSITSENKSNFLRHIDKQNTRFWIFAHFSYLHICTFQHLKEKWNWFRTSIDFVSYYNGRNSLPTIKQCFSLMVYENDKFVDVICSYACNICFFVLNVDLETVC